MRAGKPILLGLAALLAVAAGAPAMAQPLQLPGAQPFNAPGTHQAAPPAAGGAVPPRPPSLPALKIAGEETILGKALHHNGNQGAATFEKLGEGYGLKLSLDGYQTANLVEPCAVSLGDAPVLILRGALSDILAKQPAAKMQTVLPQATLVEVPGVGHAPTMDEPKARAAIDAWIAALPSA